MPTTPKYDRVPYQLSNINITVHYSQIVSMANGKMPPNDFAHMQITARHASGAAAETCNTVSKPIVMGNVEYEESCFFDGQLLKPEDEFQFVFYITDSEGTRPFARLYWTPEELFFSAFPGGEPQENHYEFERFFNLYGDEKMARSHPDPWAMGATTVQVSAKISFDYARA